MHTDTIVAIDITKCVISCGEECVVGLKMECRLRGIGFETHAAGARITMELFIFEKRWRRFRDQEGNWEQLRAVAYLRHLPNTTPSNR